MVVIVVVKEEETKKTTTMNKADMYMCMDKEKQTEDTRKKRGTTNIKGNKHSNYSNKNENHWQP